VAPILDGLGDVPPKPGSREKHGFSQRSCQSKADRPTRKGMPRERRPSLLPVHKLAQITGYVVID